MNLYGKTDAGRVRKSNQDAFVCGELSDGVSFLVVCDGVGGSSGGQVASTMSTKSLVRTFRRLYHDGYDRSDIKKMIESAIEGANKEIRAFALSDQSLKGMSTTCVCAVVSQEGMTIANVGDCRAYIISGGQAQRVTKDHSLVQELVDMGEISEVDARFHPQKNIITRALGQADEVEIDFYALEAEKADWLLLCTDGLSNLVDSDEFIQVLEKYDLKTACEKLVTLANERGGPDNITVAVQKL